MEIPINQEEMVLVSKKDYELLEKFNADRLIVEEKISKWTENIQDNLAKNNYAEDSLRGLT